MTDSISEVYKKISQLRIKTVWDLTETIQKLPLDMKVGYVDWKGDMIPLDSGDIVIRKVSLNGKPYLCLGTNLSELKGDD